MDALVRTRTQVELYFPIKTHLTKIYDVTWGQSLSNSMVKLSSLLYFKPEKHVYAAHVETACEVSLE